ncbi:MAG: metal-dependent hydrolase [Saprospiraceae bacterium]|nr:metal-dependent hydrolase [Saprospiraceae bacterium]
MASVFGHAILAGAMGSGLKKELRKPKVFILGILCSIFPDADVLGFKFGIAYGSLWGHRGMTHSILFGVLFGIFIMWIFHRKSSTINKALLGLYYAICTVSHGVLDGMTTGGMGVAYFSPYNPKRYFLPIREIQVSPLGARNFFSEWGVAVLKSEAFWIGIPSLLLVVFFIAIRKRG